MVLFCCKLKNIAILIFLYSNILIFLYSYILLNYRKLYFIYMYSLRRILFYMVETYNYIIEN